MNADRVNFKIGDLVYHRTEDVPGIVTGILYTNAGVEFRVCWQGRSTDYHTDIELTYDRPYFTGIDKEDAV